MSFIQLVRREMESSLPRLVFMAGLAGVSNAAILAAINAGASAASSSSSSSSTETASSTASTAPSLWAAGLFVIALFLFIRSQHYIVITATVEIEAIIHRLRVRLMDEVRRSELLAMEAIGRARIVAAITGDTAVLTQASTVLVFSIQSVVLIFFVGFYVAYLSLVAFVLTILIFGVAGLVFHLRSRHLAEGTREAAEWTNRLFDRLTDFLDGFKEVRLNQRRSDHLFDDAAEVSRTAANIKIRTEAEAFKRLVFSQASMYLLLGAIVFVAPTFSDSLGGGSISKATTALLFVVGSLFGLVQSIPVLSAANGAADRIAQLDAELRATVRASEIAVADLPARFDTVVMRDIVFQYFDKSAEALFKIGPIDFTLRSGELVFITGGNGSGKSTFLKVLSGLYVPDAGTITLDGTLVTDETRAAYRALIAAIFVDYHLFRRLYGIADPDPAEIMRLLTLFRLNEKTRLTDGEFKTLDLSGGQRKRLALIVSLLETRPILLLDEWTSDQDPEFRRKFYHELLPALNAAGTTIVVITHDDRYLNELDLPARRLRMDEGRFVEQQSMEKGR